MQLRQQSNTGWSAKPLPNNSQAMSLSGTTSDLRLHLEKGTFAIDPMSEPMRCAARTPLGPRHHTGSPNGLGIYLSLSRDLASLNTVSRYRQMSSERLPLGLHNTFGDPSSRSTMYPDAAISS